jgi:hypothetical protein
MRLYILLLLGLLISCSDDINNQVWIIPSDQVFDGGVGKDGIPSVDNPVFEQTQANTYLNPNDLVIGVVHNGQAKAYPHRILDWHEIVNDQIDDRAFALTYCPLTGTGVAWNREIEGEITTFGVSGKLYNTNLIPYDRKTDSYWSQMRLDCVQGELIETVIETFPIIETTWETWKAAYPSSTVMTLDTGFSRDYNDYPYDDYRTNHNRIFFPVEPSDSRLPAKERVLAVLTSLGNKVYSIESFEEDEVITDLVGETEVLVFGSKESNFVLAYENIGLQNVRISDVNLAIAEDDNGNIINMDGTIIAGPLAGTQLVQAKSILGYYFSLAAFYPEISIYE